MPSACLSCIGGTIQGTLDDGIGPGPDYTLIGSYGGLWMSGRGSWFGTIYSMNTPQPTPVGRERGVFNDPPINPGAGNVACRWVIHD